MPDWVEIYKGAEGTAWLGTHDVEGKGIMPAVRKVRYPKKYRNYHLDRRIRKSQYQSECKNLPKALQVGVRVPVVYAMDKENCEIIMEFIFGPTMRDLLTDQNFRNCSGGLSHKLGRCLGILHRGGMVHGDMTTSNCIIALGQRRGGCDCVIEKLIAREAKTSAFKSQTNLSCKHGTEIELCLIDFGQSAISDKVEDRAVDIYVFLRGVCAAYGEEGKAMSSEFEEGYKIGFLLEESPGAKDTLAKVLARLREVERRGRKRE